MKNEPLTFEIGNTHGRAFLALLVKRSGVLPLEFAARMGCSRQALSLWLLGKRRVRPMTLAAATLAAITFGVQIRVVPPRNLLAVATKPKR